MPQRAPKRSKKNSRANNAARPDGGGVPAPSAPPAADPQGELAAAERLLEQQFPPPPPPPPPPPADKKPGDDDAVGEVSEGLEGLASEFAAHPELIELLDDEELAAGYELAFGFVADTRDLPHWELKPKAALRLGKWTRRVLLRHPELAAWIAKYLADAMLAIVLSLEVGRRLAQDRKLANAVPVEHKEL